MNHPNCSNHKKEVAGISDMKVLAEMIGDLHYETLAVLCKELSKKLKRDSRRDWAAGRIQIANRLLVASKEMINVFIPISEAWQISKPFMTENSNQQP